MLRQRVLVYCLLASFLAVPAMAQNKGKIKQFAPTYKGSSGLFATPFADTLRPGEYSFGLNAFYFHREPGDLSITNFPISFSIGVVDRVEFFASYEIHKRVHGNQIQPNTQDPFIDGTLPPLSATQIPQAGGCVRQECTTAFFNDTPFLDVGFGSGPGQLSVGAKFNILSERRGDPFALAFQPIFKFDLDASRSRLSRGLSSGANDGGFDVIMSKDVKGGGTLTFSSGLVFTGDPRNVERQNEWNYGGGVSFPLGSKNVHFLGEIAGTAFFGNRGQDSQGRPNFANPRAPLDVYAGIRAFPIRWLAVTGGYLGNIGQTIDEELFGIEATDRHGFFAQLSFNRKTNRPPTVSCDPTQATVTERDSVTVNASVIDVDDDDLTITWTASGGRVRSNNRSAVFDSTGLNPGRYTVKADVTDGDGATASCSADINVSKRNQAPTIQCQNQRRSVQVGQSITLTANASDPNGDTLRWTWEVNGQRVPNDSGSFVFGTAGRSPGNYRVKVTVTDPDGESASCEFNVSVSRKPNNSPTVTLTLDKQEVAPGEAVQATARASDPDNDPLTYSWELDGRPYRGSGSSVSIDTTGLAAGVHSVKVTVSDDRGGSATDTKTFKVRETITIQMPLDNIGKAKLDEAALKMQREPRLRAVLTGYTDDRGSESANERMGLRRANSVRDYLVNERGIDASRLEVKSGGESNPVADNSTDEGRKRNRRVEVELFVP